MSSNVPNTSSASGEGGSEAPTTVAHAFHIAEYTALRAEIVKRIDLQQQLLTFALITSGAVLTAGIQAATSSSKGLVHLASTFSFSALFTYPLISLCLAAVWAQHDIRIGQIRKYICKELESGGKGWENYRSFGSIRAKVLGIPIGAIAASGTFVIPQIAAVGLLLVQTPLSWSFDPLAGNPIAVKVALFVDVIAVLVTVFLVRRHR